jgi:sulfur carrier protein ThiS
VKPTSPRVWRRRSNAHCHTHAHTHPHADHPQAVRFSFGLPARGRAAHKRRRLDVPEQTTVAALIATWALPPRLVHLVLLNGEFIPPPARAERALIAGDVLAIWPPIAGG